MNIEGETGPAYEIGMVHKKGLSNMPFDKAYMYPVVEFECPELKPKALLLH